MRWLPVLVVVVCGCNNVFDLRATKLADSPPAPPPIDAPPPAVCPATGTVPKFGDDLHQIDAKNCISYVVGDNQIAVAQCNGAPARGSVDGQLQPVTLGSDVYDPPRLAPDGNTVIVDAYNATSLKYEMRVYAWDGTGFGMATTYTPPTDGAYAEYFEFSTPSRGPDQRVVYSDYNNTTLQYELVEIGDPGNGKWAEVGRSTLINVDAETKDIMSITQASLSPDGLRLLFMAYTAYGTTWGGGGVLLNSTTSGTGTATGTTDVVGYIGPGCQYGTQVVMYADRASTTSRFTEAHVIDSIPDQLGWPYMTGDCGKLYFSALNRVYYFKQLGQ
ncbi:MAG TPA: hypothetical protein VLB44_09670 [Kofleriaceae bacterium]|nr:hypothetical protein [Kofleriaceae bacterium]